MKLERKRNYVSFVVFSYWFSDPEKDIKVYSIIRSHGFNEPKKVNAHGLSNFRESGKNLRKTPTGHFFVISLDGLKKS